MNAMLNTNAKYFHDRMVLLLLSANSFLTLLTILSVLFRLQGGGDSYIVQYRANLGISAFQQGNVDQILSFIAFAVVVFAIHGVLSWRTYEIRRELSLVVLLGGTLLLFIDVIISDALLTLR
jgi:hypothetical protein